MLKKLIEWIGDAFGSKKAIKEVDTYYWHIIAYTHARPLFFEKMKDGVPQLTVLPKAAWKFYDPLEASKVAFEIRKQRPFDYFVERVKYLK